jgi:LL-diaminopimelate aminotransferase
MQIGSERLSKLTPHFFAALGARVAALQADGKDVIRLDEGSPDLPPADHIIEALIKSAATPDHHSYQPHRGIPALRGAWMGMFQSCYEISLDPDKEILPLSGSKEGIFHLSMALLDPGTVALIPDPGYITYSRGALFAGAEPYAFPLIPEREYLPDLDAIPSDIARRARILWLNYPNNPTGATASLAFFEGAVSFAQRYGLIVAHDAAYAQVAYDGYAPPSLLQVPGAKEVAVEFHSLSKTYNMAGWRVAAIAGNPQVIQKLFTLKSNQDSGQFYPIQEASIAAITGPQEWIIERNNLYRSRRNLVLRELQALGFAAACPRASLYIWCPVPSPWKSADFCESLLEETFVSLTPGIIFGQNGEGYIRISLTSPEERLFEAMQRLRKWMMK